MAKKTSSAGSRAKKRIANAIIGYSLTGPKTTPKKLRASLANVGGERTFVITDEAIDKAAKKLTRLPRNFLAKSRIKDVSPLPYEPESFSREDLDKAMEALKRRRAANAA